MKYNSSVVFAIHDAMAFLQNLPPEEGELSVSQVGLRQAAMTCVYKALTELAPSVLANLDDDERDDIVSKLLLRFSRHSNRRARLLNEDEAEAYLQKALSNARRDLYRSYQHQQNRQLPLNSVPQHNAGMFVDASLSHEKLSSQVEEDVQEEIQDAWKLVDSFVEGAGSLKKREDGRRNIRRNFEQMLALVKKETTLRQLALEESTVDSDLSKKEWALHARHSRTRKDLEAYHHILSNQLEQAREHEGISHKETLYSAEELAFLWDFICALNRSPKPKKE